MHVSTCTCTVYLLTTYRYMYRCMGPVSCYVCVHLYPSMYMYMYTVHRTVYQGRDTFALIQPAQLGCLGSMVAQLVERLPGLQYGAGLHFA